MADVGDIADWLRGIPKITRWWLSLSIIIPILAHFQPFIWHQLILSFYPVVYQFQIWRLLTSFFYFPITNVIRYLFNLYILYSYSLSLENDMFSGRPAEYLFLLMFCGVTIVILGLLLNLRLLMLSLITSAVYVWCNQNKDTVISCVEAKYLPGILLILNSILFGDFLSDLVGILAGYLYTLVYKYRYPQGFGGYTYHPNEQGDVGGWSWKSVGDH